ncbi:hypothetical protein [Nocardioides jiangxiensis]|uniref:Phage protein n=1 Tax=Nocardioides jiangxiensis TaxID=3064524 RepID=A0ABT9AZY7_9ACTN|nr:hypothetical protein [Nocardioides sp. WY-20]MDO7868159.1 hypothetical protein [Nocardioides sp. WY-20]
MTDDFTRAQIDMLRAQMDLAAGDLVFVANGILRKVHKSDQCEGRHLACWVHSPSDWPLSVAPVYWDGSAGRAYRLCEHDVLHRDLDDYRWQTRGSTKHAGMPPWCCPDNGDCACCRGEESA